MKCPICKKSLREGGALGSVGSNDVASEQFHPFCSERCKLIDLGRWLSGKYSIPVEIAPDSSDDGDLPPAGPDRPASAV